MNYRTRVIDALLVDYLQVMGGVLIQGPKACGKTTTGHQYSKSELLLSSPAARIEAKQLLGFNSDLLLTGKTPRLIDEWQVIPELWDEIRSEIDVRGQAGQFILTGSAVPANRKDIVHSGTGRFAWLTMRSMTLWKSGESNGTVSLGDLFSGHHDIGSVNTLDIKSVAFAACRGGWPQLVSRDDEKILEYARQYLEAVANNDVSRVDGIKRDPERVRQLLRIYARNLGSQTTAKALLNDLIDETETTFSEITLKSYLQALKEIFVIEDMPSWNPNLRSKTAIRTTDTRYFSDPSIAAAALNIGPGDLLRDPKTFGFVFENLCVRDLRVYAEALHGNVFHYRDKNNLECDAVLHRRDGNYGLIEIKLGGQEAIDHGAMTLQKLASKIDTSRMPKPAFLMVLTAAGNYAYRRDDDVLVVPIGCVTAPRPNSEKFGRGFSIL